MGPEFGSRLLQVTALKEQMGYNETPRRQEHTARPPAAVGSMEEAAAARLELLAAADQGQAKAMHDLAFLYLYTGDCAQGLAWLERAASCQDGAAMFALSGLLCIGIPPHVVADPARAVQLLQEASGMNHRESQWALGVALCMGEELPQHVPQGMELLEAACNRADKTGSF